ncbi:MAG: hypothetical protein IKB01_11640 [Lachnospiraceae bacterium]|nr:hypothetical protein [Lachnospiraceae bacterium]
MSLKDMLSTAIEKAKSDPQEFLQHGLMGIYMKEQTGRRTGEKPGIFCPQMCAFNMSDCESCLYEQQKMIDALDELQMQEQKMRQLSENMSAVMPKRIVNCTFCGAPYEEGNKFCSFCDTPYQTDMLSGELPKGKLEQERYILERCVEIYNQYLEWSENRRKKEIEMTSKGNEFLSKVQSGMATVSTSMNKTSMTAEQVKLGAKRYNVGYIEYTAGVMSGEYHTNSYLEMQEQKEVLNRYHERNMEINREKNEKLRKINQERNQAMGNLFYSKHVDWSCNSTTQECWTCYYYNRPSNTCTRTNTKSDASHCCVFWK